MTLPPAGLLVAVSLLGAGVVARSQVDISANLETYRTNRHMLALPFLDSMMAPFARCAEATSPLVPSATPRRMFGICNNLGLLPGSFFPGGSGREYGASPYLETLKEYRNDFTVFSGVSHPNVDCSPAFSAI